VAVRTALGLHTGDKLDFVLDQDGSKVVPLRALASSLKGRFSGRTATLVDFKKWTNSAGLGLQPLCVTIWGK
jgi:bifunctional DNA-binding transcriptional regulator/antitoxin component of YhaV-PrlF toxin-antitoxin module